MKKTLGSYYCRYFSMPHLYRDDLETIETIIKERLKPTSYHIAFGGFEYDNLSDITGEDKPINVLVFYTAGPSLRLKLARSWAELYAGDVTPEATESVRAIADVLAGAERVPLWSITKYSSWLAPILGFGTVAITSNLMILKILPIHFQYVNAGFLVVTAVWWALGYRYRVFRFSRIDLTKRRPT